MNGTTDHRTLLAIRAASLVLVGLLILLLRHDGSFDLQYHLFFAKHYSAHWFAAWEPKWYGGFCIYTYPPLAHQLLALVGSVVGLDVAGRLLSVTAAVALVGALVNLGDAFGGPDGRHGASLLVLAWPGPFVFGLVWGQVPAMLSMGFAVLATARLITYLRLGGTRDAILWALLAGCCAGSHHQTAFVLLPLLVLVAVASTVGRAASPCLARRVVIAGVAALLASLATVGPHLWWLATQNLPQAPIPHPTRENFFADPFVARLLVTCVWGPLLLLVPFALWHGLCRREMAPLAIAIGLCGLLSLGTMTPLPSVLFRGWSQWLTYERFGLWASGLTVVLAGCWIRRVGFGPSLALAALASATTIGIVLSLVVPGRVRFADDKTVDVMRSFLDTGDHSEWGYVTLGVGENRLSRLSWVSSANTVDGFYFTARRDAVLRRSGVGTIDSALDTPGGKAVLDYILGDHVRLGVRWILSMDPRADAILGDRRWAVVASLPASTSVARLSEHQPIQVWEGPADEPVPRWTDVAMKPRPVPRGFAVLWGTASVLEFAAVLVLMACWRGTRAGCQSSG